MSKRTRIVSIALAVGIVVAFASQAIGSNPPPRPAWVDEQGRIDTSKAPARIPLLGSQGEIVGYLNRADAFSLEDNPGVGARIYADETGDTVRGTLPAEIGIVDDGSGVRVPSQP